jgi:hypothetical protein
MSEIDLKQRGEGMGYILVDLDRTLAKYESWEKNKNEIGPPIPAMVERVVRWLHAGRDVRIFTARASSNDSAELDRVRGWCVQHLGKELPIQNWKDFHCVAIWDDLAITVEPNTGWRRTSKADKMDPLTLDEEMELVDSK